MATDPSAMMLKRIRATTYESNGGVPGTIHTTFDPDEAISATAPTVNGQTKITYAQTRETAGTADTISKRDYYQLLKNRITGTAFNTPDTHIARYRLSGK